MHVFPHLFHLVSTQVPPVDGGTASGIEESAACALFPSLKVSAGSATCQNYVKSFTMHYLTGHTHSGRSQEKLLLQGSLQRLWPFV